MKFGGFLDVVVWGLDLTVDRQEAVSSVNELTSAFSVLGIWGHRQSIVTLAALRLGNSVHVQPYRYVIGVGERKELRGRLVVVIMAVALPTQLQLEAVVGVNQNSIELLLTVNLLKEDNDVGVAVHLVVADDGEVIVHPLVCGLALIVGHVSNLSVGSKLHERHLQRSCAVL